MKNTEVNDDFIRRPESEVNQIFFERWSPRAFDPDYELSIEDLRTVMEAAKWAPSCFNEQPWSFHLASKNSKAFPKFLSVLNESNQIWAKNASVLGFIVGQREFSKNQKQNPTFAFDCGSAWMSMTMQARLLGLYTHGMAGFSGDKAAELLGIDELHAHVIAAFTIGKIGDPAQLPENLREKEKMNSRKPLDEIFKLYEVI